MACGELVAIFMSIIGTIILVYLLDFLKEW